MVQKYNNWSHRKHSCFQYETILVELVARVKSFVKIVDKRQLIIIWSETKVLK